MALAGCCYLGTCGKERKEVTHKTVVRGKASAHRGTALVTKKGRRVPWREWTYSDPGRELDRQNETDGLA